MKLAVRIVATSLVVSAGLFMVHVARPVLASVPSTGLSANVGGSIAHAVLATGATAVVPVATDLAPVAIEEVAAVEAEGDTSPPAPSDDTAIAQADPIEPGDDTPVWRRPTWFPPVTDLDAVGMMVGDPVHTSGPRIRSRAAFVYDLDAGQVLLDKNADLVRPVASLTKMVSALALMSAEPDLDTELCIGAAQYPTRSGARSRLSTGDCMGGWDVLGAALVASDNRGAYALAAVSGLDMDAFVSRMNDVSADLAMDRSSWSDPSGLEDDNLSTARDIARATVAVAAHPVLSNIATAPYWDLHRLNRPSVRRLFTTDKLVGRTDLDILAAKTGYTDTARYCFSTVLQTRDGRRLVITLLGAEGKQTRWADVNRVLGWVRSEAS